MTESYAALCSDHYVNQKLNVKLDLPRGRETVLDLFERVRRQFPRMEVFKRYKDELALETPAGEMPQQWIAIRSSSIRSGAVNPDRLADAYAPHRHILEVAPYFLSVSPLDVDYLELLFGFDIAAAANHDEIIARALLAGSPLGSVFEIDGATPVECQPLIGVRLDPRTEAHFEVKTRETENTRDDPISVYLTLRRYGPMRELPELPAAFDDLAARGEALVDSHLLPHVIVPIREAILGSA